MQKKVVKVEFSKLDDLLKWANSSNADGFDELARVARFAQKELQNLYKKQQKIEQKQKEAEEISQAIEELGGRDLLGKINKAEDILKLQYKNIRRVIKVVQRATQDSI